MSLRPHGRPPFRADHVGSLLRPPALRQAFRRRAGNEIGEDEFARIQDGCVRDAVRMQEATGLEVVTDGEFRRGSYWGRFVERTEGLEVRAALLKFRDDHGHEVDFTAPYATAPLRRTHPLALDEFIFLRDTAAATAKITLPAPSTMHFLRFADFADHSAYADVDRFFADLVAIFAQEIADLVQAGCRYVQLDEIAIALLCDPAIRERVTGAGGDPAALVDRYIDAINGAVAACPATISPTAGTTRWPSASSPAPTPTIFSSSTTRPVPGISRRCASCRKARGWCWAWSAARLPCSKAWTASNAGRKKPLAISISTGSRSVRSAASRAVQPAIR
jgi:5-methyltetrahydropteroyltriglutamate--homocysteine methyltransferase